MEALSVRMHHVVLTVTDMDVSRQWYRELLGVEPVIDEAVEPLAGHHRGYYHVVFSLPGGLFGLHSHAATDKDDTFSEFRPGLDHVAFSAEGRSEIEAWQQRLTELGIKHSGIVEDKYALNLSFRDPDNIALEFWAPLNRRLSIISPEESPPL
ncbi:MAG TPA: VOC family protein [Actinomycetota bacterium]|nr:VOC family protein [Actinomycetota bacterium]